MKKVVVLGGGVGGLSVAWMLARTGQFHVTVVEKEPITGGMCGTFKYKDFSLDYGAHKIYSVIPGIMDEFMLLMGEGNYIKHEKKNRIYLFNQYLDYPVKILDMLPKMGFKNLISCGLSLLQNTAHKILRGSGKNNYKDFIINKFGHKLYDLVFRSLAEKTWGEPNTLSSDIARTRIPSANIFDLVFRALGLKKESGMTDAKYFYYPKGGFGKIAERMSQEIVRNNGVILTNTMPIKFDFKENRIKGVVLNSSGIQKEVESDFVISTIHFDNLINLIPRDSRMISDEIVDLVRKLEYRSVILVYLVLNKKHIMDEHWIFFPGNDLIFGRVFEQKNMDHQMIDKEKTIICCDFTDYRDGKLYKEDDATLAQLCIRDLEKIGFIQSGWVEEFMVKRFPEFYPRYNIDYKIKLRVIYDEIKKIDNLLLSGRIGFYNYNNADHCLDMGRFIAENLVNNNSTNSILTELEKRVDEYKIID